MSRKPPKHSDLKNVNVLGRKARRTEHLEPFEYYLIVCEGKKTEPQYFEEIQQLINVHYKNRVKVVDASLRSHLCVALSCA
jgi:hypothetical protein